MKKYNGDDVSLKKRMCLLITALWLAFSLLMVSALAVNTALTIKTPATIPKAGETFAVTVDISGNPGFSSLGFTLTFD